MGLSYESSVNRIKKRIGILRIFRIGTDKKLKQP